MKIPQTKLALAAGLLLCIPAATVDVAWSQTSQQSAPRGPLVDGQRIAVGDGDLITIDGDARVRIVRRRPAAIRTIYNEAQQWIVLLVDFEPAAGAKPDGHVDATFQFSRVSNWPLGERWEGDAIVEEYMMAGPGLTAGGVGLIVPAGQLQLLSAPGLDLFRSPSALSVITYIGSGRGGGMRASFDQVELQQVANAIRNAEMNAARGTGARTFSLQSGAAVESRMESATSAAPGAPAEAPVRVGGNIGAPRKTHDVAAVYPEAERQAGLGAVVVIVELTIGVDGAVSAVKVLRGVVPSIDRAAVQAASQWRYEPVLLNGKPVPAILTATVRVSP
jgi:TonB family protein